MDERIRFGAECEKKTAKWVSDYILASFHIVSTNH
jgi:hypothetical protein